MGKIFARSILRGSRTLADVPAMWLSDTLDALAAMCDSETFAEIAGTLAGDADDGAGDAGEDA